MPNNNNDTELRSEEVQDILTAVPNWMIRCGNTLILVLLILFILMSWFIKYPDIINTKIMVTTEIPPEKIYTKTSGKFDAFLVNDNDIIQKDTPLAIIENIANYKDVLYLKNIIDTLKVDYHNFYFPIREIPILFLGDIETNYAIFETNYTEFLLYKNLQPYSNEFNANKISINENKERLQISLSQQEIYKKELVINKKDLERNKQLYKEDVISLKTMEEKKLNYLREERAFQNLKTSASNIKEGIGNSYKSLKANEIRKIQEENYLLKQVIQSYNQLKKAIKNWEMKYLLKASLNGKVSLLKVYNKNQHVQQGDLIFTIIPSENSNYIGKIKAPILNSGKLKIDQKVNIKLSNYPSDEFGILNGIIKNISLTSDEQGNYLIDVSLPKNLITSYNKELIFRQEMQGDAEIITEDLRLSERFFYQLKNVFK